MLRATIDVPGRDPVGLVSAGALTVRSKTKQGVIGQRADPGETGYGPSRCNVFHSVLENFVPDSLKDYASLDRHNDCGHRD